MAKQYLRKPSLAQRYDTTPRTIDRMVADGRLRRPDCYNGPIPLWDAERLDEDDRRATQRPISKKAGTEKAEA
jgi:hypothetical protein